MLTDKGFFCERIKGIENFQIHEGSSTHNKLSFIGKKTDE